MAKKDQRMLLSGNEAVARGAWEAGALVATSYPGTPATEILEACAEYPEIDAEWSVNEKVALEVAVGASLAGVRVLCSMKQVGVNVAADPLFSTAYTGVNGGLVIVTADEPGLHSSQNEQDNRYYAKAAEVPMLEPADSQECKDFMRIAFEMSEQYDIPVFLRLTTRVCHSMSVVRVGERAEPPRRPYVKQAEKFSMVPSNAVRRHFDLEKRQTRLEALSNTFDGNVHEMRSLEVGVVASGISYQNVREALPDFSVCKIAMTWPFPKQFVRNFASQVKKLYVVEENAPFLEDEISALGIQVEGKQQLLRVGELSASTLRRRILHASSPQKGAVENVAPRPPQFCPGCSHRGVFYLLAKHKFIVSGDIGCYALAALPPYNAMDSLVCMGASITMAHGFNKVGDPKNRAIAVIGDSTFVHSGLTGLANLVYNRGVTTILILDNGVTAMTGHQPNPTSTWRLGQKPGAAKATMDIEGVCRAMGVEDVSVVDAYDMAALEKALTARKESARPAVVIVRRPCVFVERRKLGKYEVTQACVKCKACFKLGCPALSVEDDSIMILDFLCRGCGLCAQVCKKEAIRKVEEIRETATKGV